MGSELLRIAEGFSIVAEGLRGLAEAQDHMKTTKKAAAEIQASGTSKAQKEGKQDTAEAQQGKTATLEDIRALMAQKSQDGKAKEVKELLQKYGAVKLSAVKPEDYPALMQEAQVL